jgi:hypothetical protein
MPRPTKQEKYDALIKARKAVGAANLLRDAPRLLDSIERIDNERGRTCHEMILRTRSDVEMLLRRKDYVATERAQFILTGLNNLVELVNQLRPNGEKLIGIVGRYADNEEYFGEAKVPAAYVVIHMTLAEYQAQSQPEAIRENH